MNQRPPNEHEMMVARNAIADIATSIALHRVNPQPEVLDQLITSVLVATGWQPPRRVVAEMIEQTEAYGRQLAAQTISEMSGGAVIPTPAEPIHPPRGYCVGMFYGSGGTMIGPFATEDEARQALANAHIVIVGQPAGWQNWCGSTLDGMVCNKTKGHQHGDDPDNWHDNGSVAWPVEEPR